MIASTSKASLRSGHRALGAADEARELRVGDERRPREQHLVVTVDERQRELLEQPDRARPDGDPLALDTDVLGEPRGDRRGGVVGVAIDPGRRGDDRVDDTRQRTER